MFPSFQAQVHLWQENVRMHSSIAPATPWNEPISMCSLSFVQSCRWRLWFCRTQWSQQGRRYFQLASFERRLPAPVSIDQRTPRLFCDLDLSYPLHPMQKNCLESDLSRNPHNREASINNRRSSHNKRLTKVFYIMAFLPSSNRSIYDF